jgi:hypothetical protein
MPEAKVGVGVGVGGVGVGVVGLHGSVLVKELARATVVSEADVAKVLEHLGAVRIVEQVVRVTGKVPTVSDLRVAFKLGESTIVS